MKKIFTLFVGGIIGLAMDASAQSNWKEDFEGVTIATLPANWSQKTGLTTGWETTSGGLTFGSTGYTVPAHTKYMLLNDYGNGEANDPNMLTTSSINLTGVTGTYVKLAYYFGAYSASGKTETFIIKASTDGGNNWNTVMNVPSSNKQWANLFVDLSAYDNEPDVKLGFEYNDDGAQLIGAAIDDIAIFTPVANDINLKSLVGNFMFDNVQLGSATTPIKVAVYNEGKDTIKSLDMSYTIDGGTPVNEVLTGLAIAPFSNSEVGFTTPLGSVSSSLHNVVVTANLVNGVADANTTNNSKTGDVIVPSKSVDRNCLYEEYTSSTCPPCASFNAYFDPLVESNNGNVEGSRFNIIKYQMNWPNNPPLDPGYNAHAATRRAYYPTITGIPDYYVNGTQGDRTGSQAEIDDCKSSPAFADITGTYIVQGDSVWTDVSVTPYFSMTRNVTVYIALVEKDYYYYEGPTTQKHFHHSMRRMFPNGGGNALSTLTDNTSVNYKYSAAVVSGDVKHNANFNFWTHPKNSNLIVFIQDNASRKVLQSKVIAASWPLSIAEQTAGVSHVALYPNPAGDQTTIGFDLEKSTDVTVEIVDAVGRVVYTNATHHAAGFTEIKLNTANLVNGTYSVRLNANNNTIVKRLAVVK